MTSDSRHFDPTEDRAIVEVGKVLEAVRKYSAYSSVAFDDPVTQAVIARAYGGWPTLCSECDAQSFRGEFVQTWAAYFRQSVRQFGHLPGVHEITNRTNGFCEHIPPPQLVGDQEKARSVLEAIGRNRSIINSKPRIKPGTPGAARVEYYACCHEVEVLLAQGYTFKHVYDYMKDRGLVTCSYCAFCDNVNKLRWIWSRQ
jgi:hypothetical protein